MKKLIVIAVSLALACLLTVAYAKGSIRSNATNCFVEALRNEASANPSKTHYLRDIQSQLPKVADCTAQRNTFIANVFFDKTKVGDYIKISKPTASESKQSDAKN